MDSSKVVVVSMYDPCPEGPGVVVVNCTSRAKVKLWLQLSPFHLFTEEGVNFENLWQYSKVYREHCDVNGNPSAAYFEWRDAGFSNRKPVRFPKGRGAHSLYSLTSDGTRLSYVDARAVIYAPGYAELVVKTKAFRRLRAMYEDPEIHRIYLRDFDGYDHESLGMDLLEVLQESSKKMGHAFVIKACLVGHRRMWEDHQCHPLTAPQIAELMQQPAAQEFSSGKTREAAGVLIRLRGRFLLCHATAEGYPGSPRSDDRKWTIPKGMIEEGETPRGAAARECLEETGIDLRGSPALGEEPLCSFSFGTRGVDQKRVTVFFVDGDSDTGLFARRLVCASTIEAQGALQGFPECDGHLWVAWGEARRMVFRSQRQLFRMGVRDMLPAAAAAAVAAQDADLVN